jgi:hypothetical protein
MRNNPSVHWHYQSMKAAGYLCLFVAIAAAAYFLFWTGADATRVTAFAGLGALAGLTLVIAERATRARIRATDAIEAATQRAEAGAAKIKGLGQEVGRHRDESALALTQIRKDLERIGQCAREAKQLKDELVELGDTARQAQAQLGDLSDFNMLITGANSDDREAFDALAAIMARGQQDPRAGIARRVVFSLLSDQRLHIPVPDSQWERFGFAPDNASMAEYSKFIMTTRADLAAQAILKLRTQERFTRRERLMMFVNLIQHTQSIRVLEAACEAIGDDAKIRKNILSWREYLTWWQANEARYH